MIHSKENSQPVHCLCGVLVNSKERRTTDNEICLQSITENIGHWLYLWSFIASISKKYLNKQFLVKLHIKQQNQTVWKYIEAKVCYIQRNFTKAL